MPATLSRVSFSLAVTVVATREVVPCARDGGGNDFQRLARAFHHVVSPRPVDVDIDKARHNGFSARVDFARAARQIDLASLADGGNLAPLNHDHGIGNFFEWSECPVGVDDNRLHKDGIILLETPAKLGIAALRARFVPCRRFIEWSGMSPSNLYPQAGFLFA